VGENYAYLSADHFALVGLTPGAVTFTKEGYLRKVISTDVITPFLARYLINNNG